MLPAYWYGKNRAASLFGTGPSTAGTRTSSSAWFYYGDGHKLYEELTQKVLGLNIRRLVSSWPLPTQPLGWFHKEPKAQKDLVNTLKYRTVGLAANVMQAMGCKCDPAARREIVPAMQKGVIEAFEYNNPTSDRRFGAAWTWPSIYYDEQLPPEQRVPGDRVQQDQVRIAGQGASSRI